MAEFQKSTEALVKAGVVVGDGRLYPSAQGKRLRFDGKKRSVIDGPFAETKELVAGYWLWQVRSIDEAIARPKRPPVDPRTLEIPPNFDTQGMRRPPPKPLVPSKPMLRQRRPPPAPVAAPPHP